MIDHHFVCPEHFGGLYSCVALDFAELLNRDRGPNRSQCIDMYFIFSYHIKPSNIYDVFLLRLMGDVFLLRLMGAFYVCNEANARFIL